MAGIPFLIGVPSAMYYRTAAMGKHTNGCGAGSKRSTLGHVNPKNTVIKGHLLGRRAGCASYKNP